MKTLILKRGLDDGIQTVGTLRSVDGVFGRFTLERPWKNNQKNISCIPVGWYEVKWTWSWKLFRYTYEVTAVKDRTGVRFHPGNYFFDVEGCILLGSGYNDINTDGEKDVINSGPTTKEFEILMNRESFILQII